MLTLLALLQFSMPVDSAVLYRVADAYHVPREVVLAVAWMETRDGKRGNAPRGPGREQCDSLGCRRVCREIGRGQINPCIRWPEPVCQRDSLFVYGSNVRCMATRLRANYRSYGSWVKSIERYNGSGPRARAYLQKALAYIGWLRLRDGGMDERPTR